MAAPFPPGWSGVKEVRRLGGCRWLSAGVWGVRPTDRLGQVAWVASSDTKWGEGVTKLRQDPHPARKTPVPVGGRRQVGRVAAPFRLVRVVRRR